MSLAAASRDLGRRCVCRYQASRKLDASVDEPVCAPAKFGAGPNLRNIVLHVLGRPATTVGDKWKLRKGEAKLSKEHQHLAGHRLDVVLPALVRTGLTRHNLPADCSNDGADECSTWTNSSRAAISIAK